MNNKDVDILGIPVFKKERGIAMKVVKSQCVLYMFYILKEKGQLTKEDVMSELEISELAFWRYVQEIKAFIYNFNLSYDLKYDREQNLYSLSTRTD